jgi:lysophospholipase L1-like esterase
MSDFAIHDNAKIIFIGDSIIEAYRSAANPLGDGYVAILRDLTIAAWPDINITWINQGTSGHTVRNLAARWDTDVMQDAPDWLAVGVGFNDLNQYMLGTERAVPPAGFRHIYTNLLTRAASAFHPHLLLITPYYLSLDRAGPSKAAQLLRLVDEYSSIVTDLATQFAARLVHLQPVFARHLQPRPATTFSHDAVHPNHTGHVIIAEEVLKTLMQ